MEELYGEDWQVDLAVRQAVGDPASASEATQPGAPSPESTGPAAGAGASAAEQMQEVTPASPGSGLGEIQGSWHSSDPGSPDALTARIMAPFEPSAGTFQEYERRIRKQAAALETLEMPMTKGTIERVLMKGQIVKALSEQPEIESKVRYLKRQLALEIVDVDEGQGIPYRLEALQELLHEHGGNPESLGAAIGTGRSASPKVPRTVFTGVGQSGSPMAGRSPEHVLYTPGGGHVSPAVEDLSRRLQQAEVKLAAVQLQSANESSDRMIKVMENQTEALSALSRQRNVKNSTIKVEPRVQWPKLGDDGPGGEEVVEFYEKLEEIYGLANDGKGMPDKERLVSLKTCLLGSRKTMYDNIITRRKLLGTDRDDDAADIYEEIKGRLLKFQDTATEKQLKARQKWEDLTKTRHMTALQFEAQWEAALAKLESVGLGKTDLEKFLAYLVKMGPQLGEEIRRDRRARADGAGGTTNRPPKTWEEAHEVLVELEGIRAGTRALTAAKAAGLVGPCKGEAGLYQGAQEGGKDKGGKGKGKGGGGAKPVCWKMSETGQCEHGDNCRFSHDPSAIKAARKGKGKGGAQADGGKSGHPKAKTNPNDQGGTKGGGKKGGKGKDGGKSMKHRLCKHVRDPTTFGPCPKGSGKDCPYSHNKSLFDDKGNPLPSHPINKAKAKPKAKPKGRGRAGGQEEEWTGWDRPVGLGAAQELYVDCGPQRSVIAGSEDPQPRQHRVGLQDRSKGKGKGKANPWGRSDRMLEELAQLPAGVWTNVENDRNGTQFYTKGLIGGSAFEIMLDGGSGVNSITEEQVLSILNEMKVANIPLNDKRHPIVQLEKWPVKEELRGVAGGKSVPLLGSVVLKITMLELGKTTGPEIKARFKICKKGSTDWVGVILGARAIDCPEHGGLGHVAGPHAHVMTGLGILMERIEHPCPPRTDDVYTVQVFGIKCSVVDSDDEPENTMSNQAGGMLSNNLQPKGVPLVYDGGSIFLDEGDAAWVPVVASGALVSSKDTRQVQVALPVDDGQIEAVPGLWPNGATEGLICICNFDEFGGPLDPGTVVAEVHDAAVQTRVCGACGVLDTDAWVIDETYPRCSRCSTAVPAGHSQCRQCGAGMQACGLLTYAGCQDCRPESPKNVAARKPGRGGAAGSLLARSAIAFAALMSTCGPDVSTGSQQLSEPRSDRTGPAASAASETRKGPDPLTHPVFHIVEEPGGIERLTDIECPTEEYYDALAKDMRERHPNASPHVHDHLGPLEAFLDTSILSGFSFGAGDKAHVAVTEGKLLGHIVSRTGARCDGERTAAIDEFAPLKDQTQVRQFVGSSNWVRWYLSSSYATAVKILGEYMKPGAVFPAEGLGAAAGVTPGDKAVKAIKLMAKHAIETSVMDEAGAIDGSRPLEQIADACGYAWGSTNVQMTEDLSRFKVLLMTGKGFTPAQQAWPPLVLEGFAQLAGKRAQRKVLGPMRSLNWTDHANFTKQQTVEPADIDVKMLRWTSEIVADGSEIRSLAGRAARLGDGTSRNPKDRDELIAQRSKDLKGLIGQVRGFDLDEFLSDWENPGHGIPWALGDSALPESTPKAKKTGPQLSKPWSDGTDSEASASVDASAMSLDLAGLMAGAGVSPIVKVLYVPDYVPMSLRVQVTSKLYRDLSRLLPSYEVRLAYAEGPFEDHEGVGAHFDKTALGHPSATKQAAALKVDMHAAVVKLGRHAAMHRPKLIIGEGQGALVAAGFAKPLLLEHALATRNVQEKEAHEIGQAWGNVMGVFVHAPRMSKTRVGQDKLELAVKELFDDNFPVAPRRTFVLREPKSPHYNEEKKLVEAMHLEIVQGLTDVPMQSLIEEQGLFMWEHTGTCACGRRTFLFGQCDKCLRLEAAELAKEAQETAIAAEPTESGAAKPLPDQLDRVPIAKGDETQAVIFVSDARVQKIIREGADAWSHGPLHKGLWPHGRELELPTLPANDGPSYRLVLAVDGKDVLPVQQCVDHRREREHVVNSTAWYRQPDCLLDWEFTPVQSQLDAYWQQAESQNRTASVFPTAGPLRKFLSISMTPPDSCLFVRWSQGIDRHQFIHETVAGYLKDQPTDGPAPTHMALFGYDPRVAKWVLLHAGKWISHREFVTKMHHSTFGFMCQGYARTETRQVLTLFANKWMVYDRYGISAPSRAAQQVVIRPNGSDSGRESVAPELVQGAQAPEMLAYDSQGEVCHTEDSLRWYTEGADKREGHAEEIRAEAGEPEFKVGQSLRLTWLHCQRLDKTLMPMFRTKELARGYRKAEDGLLERLLPSPLPPGERWVPIVPDGMATKHLTWKRWMFLQCHVGVLGAHRNPEKTLNIVMRQAWWATIKEDVHQWAQKCITCLRFRKMHTKQEQMPVIPTGAECWEEVMIDLEGPNNPCDKQGNMYTMTYICTVCQGLLTDRAPKCNAVEARRMFATCMFRSGTIPTMLRSDRGPELKNAIMNEYAALLGIGRRFGTPWRPMEQGLVEGKHVETQKIMGMLVKDVMQCMPNETGELLHVVEFIVYNTPGPHGFTPRDIDRRWSLASPLERELQPFTVAAHEPVDAYVSALFKQYREIRVRVIAWMRAKSEKRADLANRFRKSKTVQPGAQVVLRDPRARKAGGRTPYRQPHSDPCEVTEVHGNKCTIRKPDGTMVYEVHLEDVLVVPDSIKNLERREPISFADEPDELVLDNPDDRRSPGRMIEDEGGRRREIENMTKMKPGKLEKLAAGNHMAYAGLERKSKTCHVGKITNISRAESVVVVHKYKPVSDGMLRLKWIPSFIEGGAEVLGTGSSANLEQVDVQRIIMPVVLHDGVLGHAAARHLDSQGYKFEERDLTLEQGALELRPSRAPEDSFAEKLERFCYAGQAMPSVGKQETGHRVKFGTNVELQKWLQLGRVDFAEIFRGHGQATIRVREAGCTAAEGFDKYCLTYERCWNLETESDQADLAWLLVYMLKPVVIHLGTPCTNMCVIGAKQVGPGTTQQNSFSRIVLEHQERVKCFGSVETPVGSSLYRQAEWTGSFGVVERPKSPWRFYQSHGCQLGVVYPGDDDPGVPIQKGQVWMANFDLSPMELRCRKPAALAGASHEHRHARGRMTCEGRKNVPVAGYTGAYTPVQATVYARCVAKVCSENRSKKEEAVGKDLQTELRKLADRSPVARSQPSGPCSDGTEPAAGALGGSASVPKPVDMLNKTADKRDPVHKDDPAARHRDYEQEAKARKLEHEKGIKESQKHWKAIAEKKDWDTILADLDVYKYSGEEVKADPRRSTEYREGVLKELRYDTGNKRTDHTPADFAAIQEVLRRKAAAFWLEGTPRTTLRHLLHDTIPTGPPVRTPPHHLKGEEAAWVDDQLQAEVGNGLLERGNSEWASPPFATKRFAEHRRQRKRRLVIDYRRVNARTLRAIYHVRSADGVVKEVAGSAYMTFLDACKGFNQIANTDRARKMLAILARSGQYLPRCLTFGPHNGPEDFAFATDRVYAPGVGRKMRFCKNWIKYADDCTVRSGRVLEGVIYTDEEYAERLKSAIEREPVGSFQPLEEAFKALGFDPDGLGAEGKVVKKNVRKKTKGEESAEGRTVQGTGSRSPHAHVLVMLVWMMSLLASTGQPEESLTKRNGIPLPIVGRSGTDRVGSLGVADCSSDSAAVTLVACLGELIVSAPIPSQPACWAGRGVAMGGKSKGKGKGRRYRRRSGGEWWKGPDERYLEEYLGAKLDYWPRTRCVSFACTKVLRHATAGHNEPRPVLRDDASMSLESLARLRPFVAMKASATEILKIIKDEMNESQKFRFEIWESDEGVRLRASQGHSGEAQRQIRTELLLQEATPDDPRWTETAFHATWSGLAASIATNGLLAGGIRGQSSRTHVHLVPVVEGTAEQAGVRGGTDTLVSVDVGSAYRHGGCRFWYSRQGVLLTEGTPLMGGKNGIAPDYIISIRDRKTGETIEPMPASQEASSSRSRREDEVYLNAKEARALLDNIPTSLDELSGKMRDLQLSKPRSDGTDPAASASSSDEADHQSSSSDESQHWRRVRHKKLTWGTVETVTIPTEQRAFLPDDAWRQKGPVPAAKKRPKLSLDEISDAFEPRPYTQSGFASGRARPLAGLDGDLDLSSELIYVEQWGEHMPLYHKSPGHPMANPQHRDVTRPRGSQYGPVLAVEHTELFTAVKVEVENWTGLLTRWINIWSAVNIHTRQKYPGGTGVQYGGLLRKNIDDRPLEEAMRALGKAQDHCEMSEAELKAAEEEEAAAASRIGKLGGVLCEDETGKHVAWTGPEVSLSSEEEKSPGQAEESDEQRRRADMERALEKAQDRHVAKRMEHKDLEDLVFEAQQLCEKAWIEEQEELRFGETGVEDKAPGDMFSCLISTSQIGDDESYYDPSQDDEERPAEVEAGNVTPGAEAEEALPSEVTAVLPGDVMLDVLKQVAHPKLRTGFADAAEACRAVAMSFPDATRAYYAHGGDDYKLLQSIEAAGVHSAGGHSDSESIRDYDSGPGQIRWSHREPYWFRREFNVNGVLWRRRMKFHVVEDATWKGKMDRVSPWIPEYDSDSDTGDVNQPSVVVPSQIHLDESGLEAGLVAEVQGYTTEGATKLGKFPWEQGYCREAIMDASAATLEEMKRQKLDAKDVKLWRSELEQSRALGYEEELQEIWSCFKRGYTKPPVGVKRSLECLACGEQVLRGVKAHEDINICIHCSGFVHKEECELQHGLLHAGACLIKGMQLQREAREKTEAAEAIISAGRKPRNPPPSEPSPESTGPAADADEDPMASFHASRPQMAPERRMRAQVKRRADLQTESSEEEGLAVQDHCTRCGSSCCWDDRCWGKDRCIHLLMCLGALEELQVQYQTDNPEETALIDERHSKSLVGTAQECQQRSEERDVEKQRIREVRRVRRHGNTPDMGDLMIKHVKEGFSYAAGTGLELGSRTILQATLNDRSASRLKAIDMAIANGREYMQGGMAETINRSNALAALRRGMVASQSTSPAIRAGAVGSMQSFLMRCPRTQFEQNKRWASEVVRLVYDHAETQLEKAVPDVQGPPDAAVDAMDDPELRKSWKSKEFSLRLTQLQDGGMKVSIREEIRSEKRKLRSRLRRLARVHKAGGAADTCKQAMPSAAKELKTDSNLREEADEAAEAAGLTTSFRDRMALDSAGASRERLAEGVRAETLRAKDAETLRKLREPGSWRCLQCRNVNLPSTVICPGYSKSANKGPFGKIQWKYCGGEQAKVWGGYVVLPERPVPEERTIRKRRNRSSIHHHRDLLKAGLDPSLEGAEKAAAEEALEAAHVHVVERRVAKRDRDYDAKRSAVLDDPHKWSCQGCIPHPLDDVLNLGTKEKCYKCSRARLHDDHRDNHRWMCPDCSVWEPEADPPVYRSISGSYGWCPHCDRKRDWFKDQWWKSPPSIVPNQDSVPPWRQTEPAPSGRKARRKRGGAKHKRKQGADDPALDRADTAGEESDEGLGAASGQGSRSPYAHDVEADRSSANRGPMVRTRSRARLLHISLSLVLFVCLATPGDAAHAAHAVAAVVVAGLIGQKAYESGSLIVDASTNATVAVIERTSLATSHVLEVVENTTIEVVERVGEGSVMIMQVCTGTAITIVLLMLQKLWQRWNPGVPRRWYQDPKQRLALTGRNPEANAASGERWVEGFPHLPWANRDVVRNRVSNLVEAATMLPEKYMRKPNEGDTAVWLCVSQTQSGRGYFVRLESGAYSDIAPEQLQVRALVGCTCPGYRISTKPNPEQPHGTDRVCKHVGGFLLACLGQLRGMRSDPRKERAARVLAEWGWKSAPISGRSRPMVARSPRADRVGDDRASPMRQLEDKPSTPKKASLPSSPAQTATPTSAPPMKAPPYLGWPGSFAETWGSVFDEYDHEAEHATRLLPVGSGELMALMSSKEAHKMACFLAGKALARSGIVLLTYTYNLPELTEALIGATDRGVGIEIIADRRETISGPTRDQLQELQRMRASGIAVKLASGIGITEAYAAVGKPGKFGTGILHTKVFRMDQYAIIGSANWTVSSKSNVEMSALVRLTRAGRDEFDRRCELILRTASTLTDELAQKVEEQKAEKEAWKRRLRTVSPPRKATASIRRSPSSPSQTSEM